MVGLSQITKKKEKGKKQKGIVHSNGLCHLSTAQILASLVPLIKIHLKQNSIYFYKNNISMAVFVSLILQLFSANITTIFRFGKESKRSHFKY